MGDIGLILANRATGSVFAALRGRNNAFWLLVAGAAGLLGAVLALPALREVFRLGALHPDDVAVVVVASVAILVWLELLRVLIGRLWPALPSASRQAAGPEAPGEQLV